MWCPTGGYSLSDGIWWGWKDGRFIWRVIVGDDGLSCRAERGVRAAKRCVGNRGVPAKFLVSWGVCSGVIFPVESVMLELIVTIVAVEAVVSPFKLLAAVFNELVMFCNVDSQGFTDDGLLSGSLASVGGSSVGRGGGAARPPLAGAGMRGIVIITFLSLTSN